MSEPEASPAGSKSSLRRMADSLLGLIETRLQLFATELQCEKLRAMELMLGLAVALGAGFIGVLVAVGALAVYLWEVAKYAGLVGLALVFLIASGVMFWRLRVALRDKPAPFSDTLAEFKKDRACLRQKN
jgi:uncharacterized membrane protein YqjE